MKKHVSFLSQLMIAIALVVIFPAMEGYAEDIHVTTTKDKVAGSLRAAITTANTNSEPDTIYLPAGTYVLTGKAGEDANSGGDLDLNSTNKITIIGAGRDVTVIDGDHLDRVFHILQGTVSISGVTVRNGKTPDAVNNKNSGDGGGINNNGTLELTRCNVRDNSTGMGGNVPSDEEGLVAKKSGSGGGIYNSSTGTLTLNFCNVLNNFTGIGGHGGLNQTGGESGFGGGVYNRGKVTLTFCTIDSNFTGEGGEACTGGNGGSGGGLCTMRKSSMTINNTAITFNSTGIGGIAGCGGSPAPDGKSGEGGGLYNDGSMTANNCTISSNHTERGGFGGGICNYNMIDIVNCTVTDNFIGHSESRDSAPYSIILGGGGGIYNWRNAYVTLQNSIVANNTVLSLGVYGPDCYGSMDFCFYTLVKDTTDCQVHALISGKDPNLGPLADNGGVTKTHALLTGSPAIDAGNSLILLDDQRGFPRPYNFPDIPNVGNGSDIGAFELTPWYSISGYARYLGTGLENVTLTFSNGGGTTTTDKKGYYSHKVRLGWSGKVIPSKAGYMFSPTSRSYTSIQANQTGQDYDSDLVNKPVIALNRTHLYFGADSAGIKTDPQTFLISNSGGGTLDWTVSDNVSWLSCTPGSGVNGAVVTEAIDAASLSPGTYNGTITVSCSQATNSPRTLDVRLTVYNTSASAAPFGFFETPTDGANVYSSIPVTGWVLDDIGVDSVKIYREENKNLVYIGDAIFVEGARPDVEAAYPNYPLAYQAGWGYMMLTNFLPNGGNGTFIIVAVARDKEGYQVTLGKKTIVVDNAHAVKPFGAIDLPAQGGAASGVKYRNQGWALTPPPNKIPEDGHTIKVWIDGTKVGNQVHYNIYRSDIAEYFPGYANSNGALAYLEVDTTAYENGVHTIEWTAVDNAGNTDGIGSRFFSIQNTNQRQSGSSDSGYSGNPITRQTPLNSDCTLENPLSQIPLESSEPIRFQMGYQPGVHFQTRYPDAGGNIVIESEELRRVEILLDGNDRNGNKGNWRGYVLVGDRLRRLPIGSTLEAGSGIFCWQPGPGFIGAYSLVFIKETAPGEYVKKFITLNLRPKF